MTLEFFIYVTPIALIVIALLSALPEEKKSELFNKFINKFVNTNKKKDDK